MKKAVIIISVLVIAFIAFLLLTSKPIPQDNSKIDNLPNTNRESESTASGELKIEDIQVGTGEQVKTGDLVTIHYLGTLENGTKFDSSYDRGQPFQTPIGQGQVIEGWDKGVVGMKVGGKRKLTIPPSMGYGNRATGTIPANSTLIFELELIDVKHGS